MLGMCAIPEVHGVPIKNISNEEKHGFVNKVYEDNGAYKGYVDENGKRSGFGSYSTRRGDYYEGEFRDDKRNGRGTYKWISGDMYTGEWKDGYMHGQGAFRWVSGDEYTGSWIKGRMCGLGTKRMANLDTYIGEWRNDAANGRGTKTFACGDRHEGVYVDDKRHGYGIYVWKNGDRYEGNWYQGEMCGRGKKTMTNGDVYEGEWLNGNAEGYGIKKFASGHHHEGYYSKDRRHGYGVYTWTNGDVYEGYWCNGQQHGKGTYYYSNKAIYKGIWLSGCKHGQGILTMDNQSFNEEWRCGERLSKSLRNKYVPSRIMNTPPPPQHNGINIDGFGGQMLHMTQKSVQADIIRAEMEKLRLQLSEIEASTKEQYMNHEKENGGGIPSPSLLCDEKKNQNIENERQVNHISITQHHSQYLDNNNRIPLTPAHHVNQRIIANSPFKSPAPTPLHFSKDNFSHKCQVCYENEIDTVLLKCGHIALCWTCSNQLETCPLCRTEIVDVIRTYRS